MTVQIDVTKLGLCTPGTPSASIHAGSWLAGYASTFQVVDHGGGAYTVNLEDLGDLFGSVFSGAAGGGFGLNADGANDTDLR